MKKNRFFTVTAAFGFLFASAQLSHAAYSYTLSFPEGTSIVASVYAEPTVPPMPKVISECRGGGTCSGRSTSMVAPTKVTIKYKTPNGNDGYKLIDGKDIVFTATGKLNKAIKCGAVYPGVWFGQSTPYLECTLTESD